MSSLNKGFIYDVRLPQFRFDKTKQILEFEEMAGVILTDKQAFAFHMGYEFGLIDAEIPNFKEGGID